MDFILRDDETPFATPEAAKSKRTKMGNDGLSFKVVSVEGGFALQRKSRSTKRIPIHSRNRLTVDPKDKDQNFEYRIVNDEPGRIQMFLDAGYEIVKNNVPIGDPQVGEGEQVGKIASKHVGSGRKGYLMRIPKEFYEEDQQLKADKIKDQESHIKRGPNKNEGQYGEVKIGRRTPTY